MANIITAGNSTNGGTAITTDTSGTLNIVTGSGSGATAVTVDGSGNVVVTGTITASGGVSGGIRSGTAVTASGTSVDFTSLPTGLKRIAVMFSGVSTNGSSIVQIQIGSGSVSTSGYKSTASFGVSAGQFGYATTGFIINTSYTSASLTNSGMYVFTLIGSNTWVGSGTNGGDSAGQVAWVCAGNSPALGGVLDRVRITTVNGTDTFDAGTINILFE